MSAIEIIQSRKAAIESFLRTNGETYWRMLNKIRKLVGMNLGYERTNLSIEKGIMNEIFADLIDGTRAWDMEKVSIEQALWANINSEVFNFVRKEKKYTFIPAAEYGETEDSIKGMDLLINTPAEDIEGKMDRDAIEKYCMNEILNDDDDEAQLIFLQMCENIKQKQIADYMRMPVEKTERLIRNIRRKISKQIPYHLIENLPNELIEKILNQK